MGYLICETSYNPSDARAVGVQLPYGDALRAYRNQARERETAAQRFGPNTVLLTMLELLCYPDCG